MTSQLPSSNLSEYLDLGNAIVYVAPTKKNTFTAAAAATDWRKLGMLKAGVQMAITKTSTDIKSGVPQRLIKRFFTEESLKVSGELMEITPFNLARAMGGLTITTTVKPSAPTPSVTASATKSAVICAAVDGFAVGDLICVGTPGSGTEQFGVIAAIDAGTKTFTLVENLSLDTDPADDEAVSKVATQSINFGTVAAPASVSLKISKTMLGGVGTLDIYILNAQADANSTLSWDDNGTVNPVGIPFNFEAISDATVESGATAQGVFTQA